MIDVILNIGTRDPEINLPEFDADDGLIRSVFEGRTAPDRLPNRLFNFSFMALVEQLMVAFGLPSDFPGGSERNRLSTIAKTNLGFFSGSKTFQNTLELSIALFDSKGQLNPFGVFADTALKINSRYNIAFLRTEQQAAFRQSQAIEAWQSIQEDKDIFPLLRYSTIGDNRVRDEHRAIDQVVKPVDSPFWDEWFPPNGFNCRCIVERLSSGNVTSKEFDANPDPIFGTNVGKTGLIFPDTHPYFDVPPPFKTAQKNNFGFTIPTDTDIRQFLDK